MADLPSPGRQALRIVQVSTWEVAGGAERTALALHHHYRRIGHRSTLVVKGKVSDDPDVLVIDNSAREKTLVGRLMSLLERKSGLESFYYPGSHRIPKLVGQPWDIMHVHNLHGGYVDLAALPALTRLAPTVLTMHDSWAFTGHCACPLDCRRWQAGCGLCPDLRRSPRIRRDATRLNLWRKRRFIGGSKMWLTTPSQWMLDEARKSYLADKPMRVVPVSVDLDVFTPGLQAEARARLDLPTDRHILLFLATGGLMNDLKDGATLLRALSLLLKKIPHVLLVVVGGSGVPDGFPELEGQILALPHEADRHKLADYYRAADVLTHASKSESAGMTIVEAMACSLPVVASAVGGVPEYVQDGKTGLLVPPGNAEALASALLRVLTNRAVASSLAQEASIAVRSRYGIRDQALSYLGCYAEMLGEAQRGRGTG